MSTFLAALPLTLALALALTFLAALPREARVTVTRPIMCRACATPTAVTGQGTLQSPQPLRAYWGREGGGEGGRERFKKPHRDRKSVV